MAVYVIVIVVVVLLLAAAYRSLGGAALRPVDVPAALRSLHVQLQESVDALSAWVDAAEPRGVDEAAVRDGRRRSAGIQQTLESLPAERELAEDAAAARALLLAGVEDAVWAWRIVAAEGASPGLHGAVVALCDHAAECCRAAESLLDRAAGGEPAQRL